MAHFKAKNVHFNWIVRTLLCLKMSADIVPLKRCVEQSVNCFCVKKVEIWILVASKLVNFDLDPFNFDACQFLSGQNI